MRKPEDGKNVYDQIEIPAELDSVVKTAIGSVDKETSKRRNRTVKVISIFRSCSVAAAAVAVCMTIGLNTSEVFAKEMGELPVIGPIARVLTIRSYQEKTEDFDVKVEVPEIEVEIPETIADAPAAEEEQFIVDINAEIQEIVDDHVTDAKQKFAEYKEAFFATGGTEEEWNNRDMAINVNYEVKYQKDNILSLVLTTDEAWVHAYGVQYYYNLDMKENRQLTLKDMLGEDYIRIANESILSQMEERNAADEYMVYWGVGDDDGMIEGFTTVDETTSFYINEKGNPVVCFEKYEVAPGYMGVQEFEVVPE